MKKVYCIIVTYNGMQWIDRCLQSLQKSIHSVSIIVIDNGSKDETFNYIKTHYHGVILIAAERNLGFGQGNNLALKFALKNNADYFFLLNQDAWIKNDTITKLIAAHHQYPQYGIISPVHLNGAGNDFDEHFFNYLTHSDVKNLLLNSVLNKHITTSLIDSPFINAAAWFITKECMHKVGGFDPIFFHYGEDDNYGQRTRYKGFKIGILLSTVIYHDKERPSTAVQIDIKKTINRDWTQFLVYACDVNNENYKLMIAKKAIRHFISMIIAVGLIKKEKIVYNFFMLKKIITSFTSITKCHALYLSDTITPYL